MATHQERDLNRPKQAPRQLPTIVPDSEELVAHSEPSTSEAVERAVTRPRQMTPGHVQALQRAFGNRAVTRMLPRTSPRLPIQAKLTVNPAGDQYEQEADRMAGQAVLQRTTGNVLQRKVIVGGERYRPSYARALGWPEYKVTMVRVWDSSDVEHKFKTVDDLEEWLDVAKEKLMGDVPDLYTKQYFKFTTEEQGRLPSLYFIKSASEHGRIRQQHSQGPIIDELGGTKQDYFIDFSQKFDQLMDTVYTHTQGWQNPLSESSSNYFRRKLVKYGASTQPSDGKKHLEVKPATGAITWVHESGGDVKLPDNHPEYNDIKIRKIYLDTAGREE